MKKQTADTGEPASVRISNRIAECGDWRGATLARMRELICGADPSVVEEWKWGGPVWSSDGILCTGETYKATVKLTFAKGASLPDPKGLFNSSLDGNTRRAIDLREGEAIDAAAFQRLVRAAIACNRAGGAAPAAVTTAKPKAPAKGKAAAKPEASAKPKVAQQRKP